MRTALKSMTLIVGMAVVALQAGAREVPANLSPLAEGVDVVKWHLYYNRDTGKMEIYVDVMCGNDIWHWVEEGSMAISESGPVMNATNYELVCFRAASDNMLPLGSPLPKMYFFKRMQFGCLGTSIQMSVAQDRFSEPRQGNGVISANFRTKYRAQSLFKFNVVYSEPELP